MKKIIIATGIATFVFLYYLPIMLSGNNLGIQDWDVNFAWNEFVRMSILVYHQFPFWDPYRCGGTAHFANPQMSVLSIQTLFVLIFGTVSGLKISIVFHGILGSIGMYLLAGRYGLRTAGKTLAVALFSFSGILSSALAAGMMPFINTAYTPWILYWFHRSGKRLRFLVPAALFFALSFYHDYHIPQLLIVYLTIHSLAETIVHRRRAPLIRLAIFTGACVVFILPRLLLSLQLMTIFPRYLNHDSGYTLSQFLYFLTSWNQSLFRNMDIRNYTFAVDENSLYIGILPIVVFLIFFVRNSVRLPRFLPLLITLCALVWLMMGNTVLVSAFTALKFLPMYDSFGVAQRFRFLFIIPFALVTGAGFDHVLTRIRERFRIIAACACMLAILTDLFLFTHRNFFRQTFIIRDTEERQPSIGFSQVSRYPASPPVYTAESYPGRTGNSAGLSPNTVEYLAIRRNIGTVSCYDALTSGVRVSGSDEASYRGEWYMLRGSGDVRLVYWSPQKITLGLTPAPGTTGSDMLMLNQNYYPGWHVRVYGKLIPAIPVGGLVGTPVDAGTTSVTFMFLPYRIDWPDMFREFIRRLTVNF